MSEAKELPLLTVKQFLEDLAGFPPDSEIVMSVMGANITVPITQAIVINSQEGKQLTVLLTPFNEAARAVEYAERNWAEQEAKAEAKDEKESKYQV